MEIVFVHFGSKFPKHLILNIERTCDLFPNHTVILINNRSENIKINKSNFRRSNFTFDEDYKSVDRNLEHPKNFRNNFWFTSLARIFALCDYVILNNSPILHIESDVLISSDFPIERFTMCDRPIAYTVVGKRSGVASIMWIENATAARQLRDYAMSSALRQRMTTDMKILGTFQEDFPLSVRILASFPNYSAEPYRYLPTKISEDFSYTHDLFDGFFDAADVGRYLFGDDPRNHRGVKLFRQQLDTSYLRPGEIEYAYSENRNFINVSSSSQYRYFSLHIHSKNVNLFKKERIRDLFLRAIKDQSNPATRILVPSILFQSIRNSLIRRLKVMIAGTN